MTQIVPLFASLILYTTVGTLVLALAAYISYKLRERRVPKRRPRVPRTAQNELIFVLPYVPGRERDNSVGIPERTVTGGADSVSRAEAGRNI